MGRSKRRKFHKIQSSKTGSSIKGAARSTSQQKKGRKPHSDVNTPLPFEPEDEILLVGEGPTGRFLASIPHVSSQSLTSNLSTGDFSFARSLADHHGFCALTATSFDTEDSLLFKYPQARLNIEYLVEEAQLTVLHGVDATKLATCKALGKTAGF